MPNFGFSEKELGLVSPPHFVIIIQEKCFTCYILLTDQISLPDCLYFLRYWSICVVQLFVNQFMTSQILKLILSFARQKIKYLENEKSF